MDIDITHHVGPAMRRQQSVNQGLQAISFSNDDLGVFGQLLGLHFHFEQLRSTANTAQGILDLMGQISNELFVGLGLVNQPLFSVLPSLLLYGQ